jgi:hypothetical protein
VTSQKGFFNIILVVIIVVITVLMVGAAWWYVSNKETICPPCSPSPWSDCNEQGIKTRTAFKCGANTNYNCMAYTEEATCMFLKNNNVNVNNQESIVDPSFIRDKYCENIYGGNPSIINVITDCERGYILKRDEGSCVYLDSDNQFIKECDVCHSVECSPDMGACISTNSCWYR